MPAIPKVEQSAFDGLTAEQAKENDYWLAKDMILAICIWEHFSTTIAEEFRAFVEEEEEGATCRLDKTQGPVLDTYRAIQLQFVVQATRPRW